MLQLALQIGHSSLGQFMWGNECQLAFCFALYERCCFAKLTSVSICTFEKRAIHWKQVIFYIHHMIVLQKFSSSSDACDTRWSLSRDGLIITGFVSSILVLILAIVLPLVLILAYNLRRENEDVSNYGSICAP